MTALNITKPSPHAASSQLHFSEDTGYCYAIEMTILPIYAAHEAVKESWREVHMTSKNLGKSSSSFNFDYLNVILAAPFAYTPAVLMAIIGFFYGLGLDCRYAIETAIETAKDNHDEVMPQEESSSLSYRKMC
ncbi:MAG TPA: hypothetical protein VL360_00960 [Gammaproteobacteria bacterium]|nr:hypothetical protein [Gammaproteobacteria bacterium]